MNKYKQNLNFYYQACNKVAEMFADQYFTDKETSLKDLDYWWITDIIGGTLYINDYFFSMDNMIEALKVGVNKKILFEFYNWVCEENGIENKSLHYYLNLQKIKTK